MVIQKAVKQDLLLRMALGGVTGGGKTWSGLEVGSRFAKFYQTGLLVIDTEHDSASLYADEFEFDKIVFDDNFAVDEYIEALHEAHRNGYGVVMIDSLSHAWMGKGGLLQFVDDVARRNKSGNKFAAWSDATPKQLELVETILTFPGHLIATMRSKMEYVLEEVKGKQVPRKVGMALQQRDGIEYEFSIVGEMTLDHEMIIGKSRCRTLTDEIIKPTKRDYDAFCSKLITWLGPSGLKARREEMAAEKQPEPTPAPQPQAPVAQPPVAQAPQQERQLSGPATDAQINLIMKLSKSHAIPYELLGKINTWMPTADKQKQAASEFIEQLQAAINSQSKPSGTTARSEEPVAGDAQPHNPPSDKDAIAKSDILYDIQNMETAIMQANPVIVKDGVELGKLRVSWTGVKELDNAKMPGLKNYHERLVGMCKAKQVEHSPLKVTVYK